MEKELTWSWVKDFCKIEMSLETEIETRITTFKIKNNKFNHTWVKRCNAEQLYDHYLMQVVRGKTDIWKAEIIYYLKESHLKDILGEIIYE